ncbi:hypothetical protein CXG81DRAFT_26974 [Caulochytrium protostelioides]|uniref:Uncharacterized protein n=1 Tax=Caulochytrium protostelioides TaxID=1555241 RepID=A0A4V1IUE9_9FUNG|nr:hypothetical protein CXG81DRAFT_26974 [Caulochytrium protostelioides]|eukprot:RKP00319.1 hypothetical protein CXG81DRAFT_26974 [Caulochytrium protostelioides]
MGYFRGIFAGVAVIALGAAGIQAIKPNQARTAEEIKGFNPDPRAQELQRHQQMLRDKAMEHALSDRPVWDVYNRGR